MGMLDLAAACDLRVVASKSVPRGVHSIEATACLSRDFIGFAGHFPGQPIVPGFVFVMLAEQVFRQAGRVLRVAAVRKARFYQPLLPLQPVRIIMRFELAGEARVTFTHQAAPQDDRSALVCELVLALVEPVAGSAGSVAQKS
ncbi:MAG: hypothetical protein HKL96_08810 [Phycisphaerales bacterium]|nr:hypothetical protein [Phycisphaerales bacterium]